MKKYFDSTSIIKEHDSRERIVATAQILFNDVGIKTTTVNDVAQKLGISKKTFYKYFKKKDALIHFIVTKIIDDKISRLKDIAKSAVNPVEILIQSFVIIQELKENLDEQFLFQLKKYYPDTLLVIINFQLQYLPGYLKLNIEKGVR